MQIKDQEKELSLILLLHGELSVEWVSRSCLKLQFTHLIKDDTVRHLKHVVYIFRTNVIAGLDH